MIDKKVGSMIINLFARGDLGQIATPITPVSGGFMHRMYRVDTTNKSYAVKHLNPVIMQRPGAKDNYKRAEALEKKLEEAGIPIVPAITIDGAKMQECQGEFFYIFDWKEGKITDWNNITAEQCWFAGEIQGKIHAIEPRKIVRTGEMSLSNIDFGKYIREAENKNRDIFLCLKENENLLNYAQGQLNRARQALPDIECIVDEDMDSKNVMWDNGKPFVIDLECLDYGNPISSAVQLSLQWSGITTCSLDLAKHRAFWEGYLAEYDCGFSDYDKTFGVAYTWIEWLEYNISRTLGNCQDEAERQMGINEVKNTVARIAYIREMEDEIKHNMNLLSLM